MRGIITGIRKELMKTNLLKYEVVRICNEARKIRKNENGEINYQGYFRLVRQKRHSELTTLSSQFTYRILTVQKGVSKIMP